MGLMASELPLLNRYVCSLLFCQMGMHCILQVHCQCESFILWKTTGLIWSFSAQPALPQATSRPTHLPLPGC